MALKVWWKGLDAVLATAYRYGTRWDKQLAANLTTEQITCVRSLMTAIADCLALLPKNTPTDPTP
jgi:hypothetical protein